MMDIGHTEHKYRRSPLLVPPPPEILMRMANNFTTCVVVEMPCDGNIYASAQREHDGNSLVDRPTQFICTSHVNLQIQKT